tara:strand:- start:27 stop:1553 length:1527 start_codon:yes stop_codon:yes gene_type:complete
MEAARVQETKKEENWQTSWKSRDPEKRELRLKYAAKASAWEAQKRKNDRLEKENAALRKKLKEQEKNHREVVEKINEGLEKTRLERDQLKELLFKKNHSKKKSAEENDEKIHFSKKRKSKKHGGQVGHKGRGYQKPEQVDEVERLYLSHCPECETELNRSQSVYTRLVQDLPDFDVIRYWVKQYEIENQWCKHCKKIHRASPKGVLPNSHYGINTVLYIMMEKYGSKSSLSDIRFSLKKLFGLDMTEGGIAQTLQKASDYLGAEYDRILSAIRLAEVKYCDETGWRIEGINHWVWGLFTKDHAYYCVDQSRGKGVIDDLLKGSNEKSVLVHDDYAAYQKLAAYHQSCWAHLLRESRRLADDKKASKEVQRLNIKIKKLFVALSKIVQTPFNEIHRQKAHQKYEAIFTKIIQAQYKQKDTKKIQTRISNQENNLITALLHEDVELTNNRAERELRPLVVTRKISYGSGSPRGAKTHMINMSVFRTLLLQGKDLLPSLKQTLLLQAASQH